MCTQEADFAKIMRKLVSDVQGAPYPAAMNNELYTIWYEHAQQSAIACFEYLDEHFPEHKKNIIKSFENSF